MRRKFALLTILVLLLTLFATPASANHATVLIYSPVANKDWKFTSMDGPEHPAGFLSTARDVSGNWTSDEDVKFNAFASGNLRGWVETATTNCDIEGPDKFVKIQLWLNDEFYGKVAYVHLRTLGVLPNTWITPGTLLGKIQNAASWWSGDGRLCWRGIHVHMEESSGQWQSVAQDTWQSYSTWVLAYTGTGITRAMRTPQQLADTQKRGPVGH